MIKYQIKQVSAKKRMSDEKYLSIFDTRTEGCHLFVILVDASTMLLRQRSLGSRSSDIDVNGGIQQSSYLRSKSVPKLRGNLLLRWLYVRSESQPLCQRWIE